MPAGKVRIIGGKWRGKLLHFPDEVAVRPTTDAIRETVFNWLTPFLPGARCLDVFAGSGALGFEALSRGASSVTLLDVSKVVVEYLKEQAVTLDPKGIHIHQLEIPKTSVKMADAPFDIIFLDPPFQENLLPETLDWLQTQSLLHTNTLLYVEFPKTSISTEPKCLSNLISLKEKTTGQVRYGLWKFTS